MTIIYSHPLNAIAHKLDDGTWDITNVVVKSLSCGCHVSGGGVLPSPLTVTPCEKHKEDR